MVLLSLPGTSFPTFKFWNPDKIAHFLLFGMQFLLLWIAMMLPSPRHRLSASLTRASLFTIIFGALSEVYQGVFTSRMADPYDILANAIGVVLTLLAILAVGHARVLRLARWLLRL